MSKNIDRKTEAASRCSALLGHVTRWLAEGTYRSIMHRHDGTFVASDESERKFINAETLIELGGALKSWPQDAHPLPPSKYVRVVA